ncbi:MAG: hypothetical protein QOJ39_2640, partial [Candidatus Eremiobacteraeota bacterium]|nr:hypothetical protein [Candidatus Eremiobacteraeota bacterium]
MSTSDDGAGGKPPGDEHARAAEGAASSAAGATPGLGVPGSTVGGGATAGTPLASDNPHIEGFKQVVMTDASAQNELSSASDEDDFIHRAVAVAKRFNFHFSFDEA